MVAMKKSHKLELTRTLDQFNSANMLCEELARTSVIAA